MERFNGRSSSQIDSLKVVFVLFFLNCVNSDKSALLIIDVQNCFTGNGSLSVPGGEEIIPVINKIREVQGKHFVAVLHTQDWHCSEHVSFASQHQNHIVHDVVNLTYTHSGDLCQNAEYQKNFTIDCSTVPISNIKVVQQTLWPDHCIEFTQSSEFHKNLFVAKGDIVVKKGTKCQIDSYSGFFDNGGFTETEMQSTLLRYGVTRVFLVGLALDYCVFHTANDAKKLGFNTYVVLDATAAVAPSSAEFAKKEMINSGITLVNSSELTYIFSSKASGEFLPHATLTLCCSFALFIMA